ncbi:hypothetical protein C8Q75DRAFT_369245 [Abortiporus biennis]|nr:hypothetical protein C8Q75DRAFT_369245 [Abortiporus biennis]
MPANWMYQVLASTPASIAHGPGLIGTMLNVMLYGIMVAQTFLYFNTYLHDRIWMKALVAVLFIADTANCIFDIAWIYDTLINHFNDPAALQTGNWVFATDPAMVGIIATITQLFFAWRVKVLTDNTLAVLLIVATSLCSLFGGIGTSIAISIVPQFQQFQKFKVIVIVWLIGAAVCDTAITIALTIYLRKHKTGFSNTDGILNKIIRLTVQNGLLTAVWAIVDLAAFLATDTGLHLAFNFPLSKLYTNSLMSTLNSRAGWKFQSSESTNQKNIQLSDGVFSGRRDPRSEVFNLSTTTRPEVYINVESHQIVDSSPDTKLDTSSHWSQHSQGAIDKDVSFTPV